MMLLSVLLEEKKGQKEKSRCDANKHRKTKRERERVLAASAKFIKEREQ
jgi:hypothetical protein